MQVLARESVAETKTTDFAIAKGMLVLKLNVLGRRGWPDRLYIHKGKAFFIEFKRQGEKPSKLQEAIHVRIRQHGIRVFVVDSWAHGIDIISSIAKED